MKKLELKKLIKEIIKEEISQDQGVKTKHFSVKFNEPDLARGAAKIFLNGNVWFANSYVLPKDYGKFGGYWVINKHKGAFDLYFETPNIGFINLQSVLDYLEKWYLTKK